MNPNKLNKGYDTLTESSGKQNSIFRWDETEDITLTENSMVTSFEILRDGTSESETVGIVVRELTASKSVDFTISPTSVIFEPGEDTKSIEIKIIDDAEQEGFESFILILQDPLTPSGNTGDELVVNIKDNDGIIIEEFSGFIGQTVDLKCDINSAVPPSEFDEYNKVEVYRQVENGTLETADKVAERTQDDMTTTVTPHVQEKYVFTLATSDILGGDIEVKNLIYEDSGYYWCVFKGPTHNDMQSYDQVSLRILPCAGANSSLVPTNETCIDLEDLSKVNVTEENIETVADILVETTEDIDLRGGVITEGEVENFADVIGGIVGVGNGSDVITNSVIQAVSNILVADEGTILPTDQNQNNSTSRITQAVETQVILALQQTGQVQVVESNLAVQGINLDTSSSMESEITGIGFGILTETSSEFQNNSTKTYYDDDGIKSDKPSASIFLSMDIVQQLSDDDNLNFAFVAYRNDFLFPSNKSIENNLSIEGVILSAKVEGIGARKIDTDNLPDPVVIKNDKETDAAQESQKSQPRDHCHIPEPECVFWDYDLNGGVGDWSNKGCRYVGDNEDEKRICQCDHLTNFAVLVYHGKKLILSEALDVISKVGCGLSIAALIITVVIFAAFRRLRKKARTIMIHLCVSLIALYVIFLVAIDRTCPQIPCIVTAALIHYFTLTTLAWMGVEATYIYIKLVRVFDPEETSFVLKSAFVAWGIPVVIVAISLGAGFESYKNDHYCFPKPGLVVYLAILLPIAIVLLHNMVRFALVLKSICRRRPGKISRSEEERKQLLDRFRNGIAISCLLGLTWIFGFLAIDKAALLFQVLFCIFNAFQGVFIFFFFCVSQKDVRKAVRSCCFKSDREGGSSSTTGRSHTRRDTAETSRSGDTFHSTGPSTGLDNRGIELDLQANSS